MSLFPELAVSAEWFEFEDSDSTKINTVDLDGDSTTISIYITRISDIDAIVEGDILGEYRANVTYEMNRGDIIKVSDTEIYQVSTEPRYNSQFKEYHLRMKKV